MEHEWLKVFHVVGFIFWMGGLMVLTRIQAFRAGEAPEVQDRLAPLEKKVYWGFAVAGLVLTLLSGVLLLHLSGWLPLNSKLSGAGFHIKLTFVALLLGVHGVVHAKMKQRAAAGLYKALHAITGTLLLAIVISVLVVRPIMYQKAQAKRAVAAPIEGR